MYGILIRYLKIQVGILLAVAINFTTVNLSYAQKYADLFQNTSMEEMQANSTSTASFQAGQPLSEALKKLEKRFHIAFLYQSDLVKNKTIKKSGRIPDNLKKAIKQVIGDYPLTYKELNPITYGIFSTEKKNAEVPKKETLQRFTVKGKVIDSSTRQPLPGVNVYVKGTTNGVATDPDGKYSLSVSNPSDTLVFSYIGYKSQYIAIDGKSTINVRLKHQTVRGKQLVVIGYGTQEKENVIGAVDQVQSTAIKDQPVSSVTDALQGASPSIEIQQTSFQPGASPSIDIRGISTMNSNAPLIVINGIPGGNLSDLNPSDIESITVLKDAGSAAIYGSRSSNGVILVTTKKGKKNSHPEVSFSSQTGVNVPDILYKPVKGYVNAILRDQAAVNSGSTPIYSPSQIQMMKKKGDSEWFMNRIFQEAMQQNYNLSISGGGKYSTYRMSGRFFDQRSNLVGPNYGIKRYNLRMATSTEYGRFDVTTNLAFTQSNQKRNTYSDGFLIADASRTPPYYYNSMQAPNGHYLINDVLTQFNPLGILEKGGATTYNNSDVIANINASFKIANDLHVKGVFGANLNANSGLTEVKQVNFYSSPTATQPSGTGYGATRNTNTDNSKVLTLNSQIMVNYSKTIANVNQIKALLGVSNESYTSKGNGIREEYTDPSLSIPVSSTIIQNGTYTTPQATAKNSLNSVFGRADYTYNSTYLFEFDFRYDGSSKFASQNRWGFFPSVSLGWRLTNEKFMNAYREKIGTLKLRASYGILGNQNVGNYQYQTTYNVFSNAYGFDGKAVSGTGFTFGNQNLSWEKSATFDIGLDATLFDNKLSASFDFFNKLTSDILITPTVPGTYGGAVSAFNAGAMRDQGWEVNIGYTSNGPVFHNSINFNVGNTWNRVVAFKGGQQINTVDEMSTIIKVGLPFNSYYGYKTDGFFQNEQQIQKDAKPVGVTVQPGDVRYMDKNGDGVINSKDRYVLGNAFPQYTFGLQYDLGWKHFDLNITAQGVGKRTLYLRGEQVVPYGQNYGYVMYQHQLNFWTPVNPNAKYPRLAAPGSASDANNWGYPSSIYAFNAAYVRLKNVRIGYSIPQRLLTPLGLSKIYVYVTGQNLLTISQLSFINPQSSEFNGNMQDGGANSGRHYPPLRYYGFGINLKF